MGLEGEQSGARDEETVDPTGDAEIDDEPTTMMDSADRERPDSNDGQPPSSANGFDPMERTGRLRPAEIDRRALPFKKWHERRSNRTAEASPQQPDPQQPGAVAASVWSRGATVDPRDLPSSLAPRSGDPMRPSDDPPEKSRMWIGALLMGAFLVVGFVAVTLVARCG